MSECVVFIVGEGPSDIGWLASEPSYRPPLARTKRAPATTGFVPPVVERVAEEHGMSVKLDGRKLTTLGKATPEAYLDDEGAERAGASALTGKAMAAAKLAEAMEADVVVFVADADRTAGVKRSAAEGRRRWRAVHDALHAGLAQGSLPFVVGVPLRMVEAWALGGTTPPPTTSPELLWGAKLDPTSNYPKHVLTRALGESPNAEHFADIARAAHLDVIAERCPVSFAPFLGSLREVASSWASASTE